MQAPRSVSMVSMLRLLTYFISAKQEKYQPLAMLAPRGQYLGHSWETDGDKYNMQIGISTYPLHYIHVV